MSVLRRMSNGRLLALLGSAAAAAVAAGAIAVVAAGGGGATPPPQPLADAAHAALSAPKPDGVFAHVRFTNDLLPSGLVPGAAGSALLSGATGRLWTTADGRGRIELQSDAGDTQITWDAQQVSVYDSSANTVYRAALPQHAQAKPDTPPTLADVAGALATIGAHCLLGGAAPDSVAGVPAYSVTAAPKANGGLVGNVQLSWDAAHGVPLRIAVTAKGATTPVLELELQATDISLAAVSASDVTVAPPAGAKVVDLSAQHGQKPAPAAPSFAAVAPGSLAGRQLTSKRVVGDGFLLTYGDGLGAVLVHESAADAAAKASPLPPVLETPLGTVVRFDRGGVSFLVGGSVTKADAESAAAALEQ